MGKYLDFQIERASQLLMDPYWRINNLYKVVTKGGLRVTFKLNWAQDDLYKSMWFCNLILKARQLGISTYTAMLFLDRAIFNSDVTAGIIAHTREDAEKLFKKIKLAYDCLPQAIKSKRKATVDSARELQFSNGSSLRVGTSMRGSTLQYLHISEFGKICAKYPEKAEEIVAGSLNTIASGQYVFIESTAEGSGGQFYDMCQKAIQKKKDGGSLTPLDYKFHFYPWWKEPEYSLGEYVIPNKEDEAYFKMLASNDIHLSGAQQAWYIKKKEVLGDSIYQEYPSTPEESFQGSASGLFYGKLLSDARVEKRIGFVPYDRTLPVHTAWDLGRHDYMSVWFFQLSGRAIRLIDFYQDTGLSLADAIQVVKSKPYSYGVHLAPHDIKVTDLTMGQSRLDVAYSLGVSFREVPRLSVIEGIDAVRNNFNRFWIDETKCSEGVRMLDNYRKMWDERLARWSEKPLHDYASNAADALRMLCVGLPIVEGDSRSMHEDAKAIRNYFS